MSDRDIGLFLLDIRDSVLKIEKYTQDLSFQEFCANEMVVDAVIRNLEVIGEASSHIPVNFRKKYGDVPWSRLKSMRNIVIHEYFGVDSDIVWKTVNKSLPELKEQIETIIKLENIN